MNEHWIQGRFEGTYEGKRLTGARGEARARRFSFRVRSGEVRDAKVVEGPPHTGTPTSATEAAETLDEIRQDRVGGITLSVPELGIDRPETSLFDVRITEWRLSRPAEAGGRSFGRIEGTIYARLTPPAAEPLPDVPPDVEVEPEPGASPVAAPGQHDRSPNPPLRGRARRRRDPALTTRSRSVEGPDAHVVYDRLLWWTAIVAWLGGAIWLESACGMGVAATWAGATGAALCLRRLARSAIREGMGRQGGLAFVLVATQAAAWLEPLAHGAPIGCRSLAPLQIAALGGAVVAAALLKRRGALIATSLVWTLAVCAWCASQGGACTTPVAGAGELESAASANVDEPDPAAAAEHHPGPRTSADGHWPVMPGQRSGGSGAFSPAAIDGAGSGGVGFPAVAPGTAHAVSQIDDGVLNDRRSAPSLAGTGMSTQSTEGASTVMEAGSSPSPAAQSRARRGGAGSTRGGWVAADHRGVASTAELISLEHANRVPDDFFGRESTRRVYVPTDAIFEPGGADIRASGALQLGRVAALLGNHPGRRTLLVVHTDIAGGLEAQQRMSERRAASVRSWLLDRGHLNDTQFEVVGAGATRPLVPPDGSYAAQQPNRRIEISLSN